MQTASTDIVAPLLGKVVTVKVMIDPKRDWKNLVKDVAPDSDHIPREFGKPTSKKTSKRGIILVNFGIATPSDDGYKYQKAYGEQYDLRPATDREIISAGLDRLLEEKIGPIGVIICQDIDHSFGGVSCVTFMQFHAGRRRVASILYPLGACDKTCWFAYVAKTR